MYPHSYFDLHPPLVRLSDSILTEILQGIAENLLVFVDVTTVGMLGSVPMSIAELLCATDQEGVLRVPPTRTLGEALSSQNHQRAIERLLDVGAIVTKWTAISPDLRKV